RKNHATAAVGGRIYMLGGDDNFNIFSSVEAYDPGTDTWSPRSPLPTRRTFPSAAIVNDVIYVIGGDTSGGAATTREAYDPPTGAWSADADLLEDRSQFGVGVANGTIYATGGVHVTAAGEGVSRSSTVEAFTPQNVAPLDTAPPLLTVSANVVAEATG